MVRWTTQTASGFATAMTPTWSWRPTRAPPTCPTRPTGWPTTPGSGWVTPSPVVVPRAMTTRHLASPPRVPGDGHPGTLGGDAKGAWVAIARHFRELGLDIFTDEITVAGIGDMSGD